MNRLLLVCVWVFQNSETLADSLEMEIAEKYVKKKNETEKGAERDGGSTEGRCRDVWGHQSTIVMFAAAAGCIVVNDEKEWYLLDRTSYLSLNYAHNSAQAFPF